MMNKDRKTELSKRNLAPAFRFRMTTLILVFALSSIDSMRTKKINTADKTKDVPAAVKTMLKEKMPCVVDFKIEREENVWPMVPAGKSLNEMDGLDILESMA